MDAKPVLVLKTGEALPPVKAAYGDFELWIARGLGRALDAIRVAAVHEGERLPDSDEVGGVVVTGSPAMVSDREPWSEGAAEWLADVTRRDALPVLGLCYGHQLIAHGLGGRVAANPMGREMGTRPVHFPEPETDEDLGPLFDPGIFPAHFSHVESVIEPPPGARVLASTDLDPHSALEFGPRQWGVQFHPEFDRPIMQGYVAARREVLGREGHDAESMIAGAVDTPRLSAVLERVARLLIGRP